MNGCALRTATIQLYPHLLLLSSLSRLSLSLQSLKSLRRFMWSGRLCGVGRTRTRTRTRTDRQKKAVSFGNRKENTHSLSLSLSLEEKLSSHSMKRGGVRNRERKRGWGGGRALVAGLHAGWSTAVYRLS